ncbi:MAG: hypothetical protein CL589_18890 [Alteromonadaceae bacterium]|nr:hypothetical protein [Alteromonadaceae bacterium]|tara:strand:+ start:4780 stop:5751 length:972 start_codon:yes stop_codon:yes gene_type:complete
MSNPTVNQISPIQVGLNSADISGSLRLYSDLGFKNGGGHMIWGRPMNIQGLPDSARGLMWWLVAGQKRTQLEFFSLDNPRQKPLPLDWKCCDIGWTRFGIRVSDLNAAKQVLMAWDILVSAEMKDSNGCMRLAFRAPFVGCFVELIESPAPNVPDERGYHEGIDPTIVYATNSVPDLEKARLYYRDVLELEITDDNDLHTVEHEQLWDLTGAKSNSFLVKTNTFTLEVVEYISPVGRSKPASYTVADQGILNVAFASTESTPVKRALNRLTENGFNCAETIVMGPACGAYVLEPDSVLEICAIPPEIESAFGFEPLAPFFGQE